MRNVIFNITYTKCYLCKMLPKKCTIRKVTIQKCTILKTKECKSFKLKLSGSVNFDKLNINLILIPFNSTKCRVIKFRLKTQLLKQDNSIPRHSFQVSP